jgi:adiponectin receptor
LQDNVQAAWQGSALNDKLHQLQDSIHNVELSLQHKAAGLGSNLAGRAGIVQAALMQQLKPILQWPVPRWPVYVYFAGAMVCLLTSSTCHLLGCCQQHIAEMVWRFDYAGIAVLIVASFVPAMYYAFLCEPFWRNFYLGTTISMGEPVVSLPCSALLQLRIGRQAALLHTLGPAEVQRQHA